MGIVDDVQVFVRKPDHQLLAYLEERRRNGLDHKDEVWDGVLHVVPPASLQHQSFAADLMIVLKAIAKPLGLEAYHEVGVFDRVGRETNYRTPDVVVASPQYLSARGVEARAEIVIEVLSPDDESRKKFEFYAGCGVPEFWIVHPVTRAIEVYELRNGAYSERPAAPDGTIEAPRLGLALRVVEAADRLGGWQRRALMSAEL
jgi:Uma2 family endonuclease